jgi:MYXO-CTERM domain-containing protein
MMSPRILAEGLLSALRRRASAETESWATAMLRELDYVDSDRSALWWALGGAAALWRRRRSFATGALVAGTTLFLHVATYG